MASTLYSDIASDPAHWTEHAPDHAGLLAFVGGGATTARGAVQTHLTNLNTRSPTLLAFVLSQDPDHIHIGYGPAAYPAPVRQSEKHELSLYFLCRQGSGPKNY